jgi:hypothetical protein
MAHPPLKLFKKFGHLLKFSFGVMGDESITISVWSRATRRKNGEREVIDGNDGDAQEASADAVLQTVDER